MRVVRSPFVKRSSLVSVVLACGALLVAGCSSSGSKVVSTPTTQPAASPSTSSSASTATASTATVLTHSTKLGLVLTDASGMTLYTFGQDTAGATTSACTGACASAWPPLTTTGTPTAGPGVSGTLGTISGGQVTWNGHPLYRWMGDHAPGDATGDGVAGFHVALAGGSSSAPATTAAGGAGY
jgi:predicted lipoprotein with Yx(FWY)xxD motif